MRHWGVVKYLIAWSLLSHYLVLKKTSLETNKISSFCPISNLKFAAKAIEKVVVL